MANDITGGYALTCDLVQTLDAGTNRINAYPVPVQPAQSARYTTGTAANQAQKIAQRSGTAAAAVVDVDLATVACVDGSTGFAAVRELVVYNRDATNVLKIDGTVTNPWTPYVTSGTPVLQIQPGANLRVSKPLGATGYAVSGGSKVVRLDPGANNIAYEVVVVGN